MIKIRKIKDDDTLEWVRGSNRVISKDFLVCENPIYSRVVAIMVSKLGKWHDEIMFIEPSLSIVVVIVYKSKKIYLHEEYRPKVMKEDTVIKPNEFDNLKLESLGRWSLEVPRGVFDPKERDKTAIDAVIRETKEETTLEITKENISQIGNINPNTALATSTIAVFMAESKSDKIKEINPDEEEAEKIRNGKWYTIKKIKVMISENKIFCAMTLAALNLALVALEKNQSKV